jgi:hypothetical protein
VTNHDLQKFPEILCFTLVSQMTVKQTYQISSNRPFGSYIWRRLVPITPGPNPESVEFTSHFPHRWSRRYLHYDPSSHSISMYRKIQGGRTWYLDASQIQSVSVLPETPALVDTQVSMVQRVRKWWQLKSVQGQVVVIRCGSQDSDGVFELWLAGESVEESREWYQLIRKIIPVKQVIENEILAPVPHRQIKLLKWPVMKQKVQIESIGHKMTNEQYEELEVEANNEINQIAPTFSSLSSLVNNSELLISIHQTQRIAQSILDDECMNSNDYHAQKMLRQACESTLIIARQQKKVGRVVDQIQSMMATAHGDSRKLKNLIETLEILRCDIEQPKCVRASRLAL